ncbi:hypothetical protein ACEUZ9_004587 [Paracoccus litorisediminis]|uniref:hypothetical protein n=1 Tax=Paracoccus litorisediminis TaxID=2006130 RepID=UPI00372E7EC8
MATQPKSNSRKLARSEGRDSAKASRDQRSKRAQSVARKSASATPRAMAQKSLSHLLEHALKDI